MSEDSLHINVKRGGRKRDAKIRLNSTHLLLAFALWNHLGPSFNRRMNLSRTYVSHSKSDGET